MNAKNQKLKGLFMITPEAQKIITEKDAEIAALKERIKDLENKIAEAQQIIEEEDEDGIFDGIFD